MYERITRLFRAHNASTTSQKQHSQTDHLLYSDKTLSYARINPRSREIVLDTKNPTPTNVLAGSFTKHKKYGSIKLLIKNKTMRTKSLSPLQRRFAPFAAVFIIAALALSFSYFPRVYADRYQDQINALNAENATSQSALNNLLSQASSYEDAINRLQMQINAVQVQIDANLAQQRELQAKIEANKLEIERQRGILRADIREMYKNGQMSTVEMLASSKDLSDFVDSETYRTAVQNKIQKTLTEINKLQAEHNKQKALVEQLLKDQQAQQASLDADRAQQAAMLAYNETQQSNYNSAISANKSKIAELRRQQAIENARFIGAAGTGSACGGGYPGSASGPWGPWGCDYPLDYNIDNWGMYNRECVSYTAFKVAASGRHMPYWGNIPADAKYWDDNAIAAGIPVDTNPQPGDIAVSNRGTYGHVMYVEHVYGDGTIYISQYNAGWDGKYSEARISAAGLNFIHFP